MSAMRDHSNGLIKLEIFLDERGCDLDEECNFMDLETLMG
jgi:hypothetical protein